MAFMVRHLLSRGLRTRLAAGLGGFSTQIAGFPVGIARSDYEHASVATGALAVSLMHSHRGLNARRGRRRRRLRAPTSAWCWMLSAGQKSWHTSLGKGFSRGPIT